MRTAPTAAAIRIAFTMLLLFSTMRRVHQKRRGTRQLRMLLCGVAPV
jgi:hypothetical protein